MTSWFSSKEYAALTLPSHLGQTFYLPETTILRQMSFLHKGLLQLPSQGKSSYFVHFYSWEHQLGISEAFDS